METSNTLSTLFDGTKFKKNTYFVITFVYKDGNLPLSLHNIIKIMWQRNSVPCVQTISAQHTKSHCHNPNLIYHSVKSKLCCSDTRDLYSGT
jgi:hypothetical protein